MSTRQEVKMSEQVVKRYSLSEFAEQHTYPIGPGTYVNASDYDALHAEAEVLDVLCQSRFDEIAQLKAEAEALRAENGRLLRVAHHNLPVGFDTEASITSQLEAARGLLEQCALSAETLRVDSMAHAKHAGFSDGLVSALRKMTGVISGHGVGSSAYPSQREAINATQAPEARHALSSENQRVVPPGPIIAPPHPFDKPSLLKDCNVSYSNSSRPLAEQGERQEAVVFPSKRTGATGFAKGIEDGWNAAIDAVMRLNATPQPGPDVRGMASFALELIDGAWKGGSFDGGDIQDAGVRHGLLIIEQRDESCGEHCDCAEHGFPAECYRLTPALAAHRQAQKCQHAPITSEFGTWCELCEEKL